MTAKCPEQNAAEILQSEGDDDGGPELASAGTTWPSSDEKVETALQAEATAGTRFNRNKIGLSNGLKNGLRFHFDSATCLNYQCLNIFLL